MQSIGAALGLYCAGYRQVSLYDLRVTFRSTSCRPSCIAEDTQDSLVELLPAQVTVGGKR